MGTLSAAAFEQYLKHHTTSKGDPYTHTKIGDPKLNIFPGSYNVPPDVEADFIKKYYNYVFVHGKQEYLTEKQLIENGPILVDIDLRYDASVAAKQHTEDHIVDAVMLYADKISELVTIAPGANIDVYVMEKNDVNKLDGVTKDGIHLIFGIQMHKALQVV